MARRRAPVRDAAYHEAGHAVATYFRPLAGKTSRVSLREQDIPEDALGLHSRGRIIEPVVGYSVDREQVRAYCVVLLAGSEAEMRFRGDDISGGGGDYESAYALINRAIFDAEREASILAISVDERAARSSEELYATYGVPVVDRLIAMLEELRAEAGQLIEEKCTCVEAVAKALYRHKAGSNFKVPSWVREDTL